MLCVAGEGLPRISRACYCCWSSLSVKEEVRFGVLALLSFREGRLIEAESLLEACDGSSTDWFD